MTFKERLHKAFSRKQLHIFGLFFLLSFSFLLLTKLSKDYTKTVRFSIDKLQVPEEQMIVADSSHFLDITLKTYGFKLFRYLIQKPRVDVNFLELDKTKNQYLWIDKKQHTAIVQQFDNNVEIIAINPDTLKFIYDVNYVKKVPIEIQHKINFTAGYDVLKNVYASPDSIKIIGPKILIDTIESVKTKPVILKNIKAPISQITKLVLPINNNQVTYSQSSIIVKGDVVKFTEGEVEVPVIVKNVPGNVSISFFPKTVKLLFYTSLNNFNSINSEDFQVECDYNTLDNTSEYLRPKITRQPSAIKRARLTTDKIEYIIKEQ